MKIEITRRQIYQTITIFALMGLITIGFWSVINSSQTGSSLPLYSACKDNNINITDKNWFIGLEYSGGFCERLGLVSSVIVQQDANGNKFGIPVCVERRT